MKPVYVTVRNVADIASYLILVGWLCEENKRPLLSAAVG